jgi:catechol 2,3-dioxygenase-like lactoylglutathione lyase family enzyme
MDHHDFKLAKISNVMLGVRDLPRAVAFYRDKLGLAVQFEIPGFAFLSAGPVTLCLSESLARALAKPDQPLGGVAELVFSVDDIELAFAALSGRGVNFIRTPHHVTEAQWAANFEDPDGHKLSIFGPRNATS